MTQTMPLTPPLRFSLEEYASRLSKTRHAMQAQDIDLLIVSDPSNMAWLTGYDGWSFYVHQAVIVPLDGEPVWFGRIQDGNGAKRTVYMHHDNIIPYPDDYVQATDRHPMDYLVQQLAARGLITKHIGVEMDNYYFSAAAFRQLQQHLPAATFHDATALVNWQRAQKSEQELAYMRRAARIVEKVHERILEKVEPGIRKNDLVADIFAAIIRGTDDYGGDYPAIVPLLPTGVDASAPHLTWDDKPMQTGAGTFFEVAGCYHRYHAPLSRTVFLGEPDAKWFEGEKALQEGIAAAMDTAKPGNTCGEVAKAFFDVLAKYGIEKDSRCGYPIGLSYPPDWGERTMSFRTSDTTVLEPNMTFHLMPGLWFDDWGLEISESIVITETGAEAFCNVPRQLFVKN